jgi:hypothetical protein
MLCGLEALGPGKRLRVDMAGTGRNATLLGLRVGGKEGSHLGAEGGFFLGIFKVHRAVSLEGSWIF